MQNKLENEAEQTDDQPDPMTNAVNGFLRASFSTSQKKANFMNNLKNCVSNTARMTNESNLSATAGNAAEVDINCVNSTVEQIVVEQFGVVGLTFAQQLKVAFKTNTDLENEAENLAKQISRGATSWFWIAAIVAIILASIGLIGAGIRAYFKSKQKQKEDIEEKSVPKPIVTSEQKSVKKPIVDYNPQNDPNLTREQKAKYANLEGNYAELPD